MHNGDPTQTDTETLIKAMRHLAENIYSEDGTANAAIAEAADRLVELQRGNEELRSRVTELAIECHVQMNKVMALETDNRRLHMVIEDLQCGN